MRTQRGITLIELMIAMFIALVMTAAISALFVSQSRNLQGQQGVVETQDNARIALEVLTRDLRNTGFFVNPAVSLRIEDNCATSNLKLDTGTSPVTWRVGTAGSGTQVISNGNNTMTVWGAGTQTNGTNGNDACPNGSDRITLAARPRSDTVTGCNALGCANNSGLGTVYEIPCEGPPPGCGSDAVCKSARCTAALEKVCEGCGTYCSGCPGGNPVMNRIVTACDEDDPLTCFEVQIDTVQCCTNSGSIPNGHALKFSFASTGAQSFSGSNWSLVGGHDNGLAISGFNYRTYQLLDLDGDGSTELVYSDKFHSALGNAGTSGAAQDPQWTVVAYGVEDLQFSWAKRSSPAAFLPNLSLWNTPNCTAASGYDCLEDLVASGGDPPIAVRVSAVVRSLRREVGADDRFLAGGRPALENNAGDASAAAQGYRRRVVSTLVGLRNLQSAGN